MGCDQSAYAAWCSAQMGCPAPFCKSEPESEPESEAESEGESEAESETESSGSTLLMDNVGVLASQGLTAVLLDTIARRSVTMSRRVTRVKASRIRLVAPACS